MTQDGPKDDAGSDGSQRGSSKRSPAQGGPGPTLAAAREDMGVSAREIADALNLPLRVVEGIEANDASVLPPTAFARGYVRSYAKLFDLDADALVSAYEDMVGETHTAEVVVVPAPEPSGMANFFSAQPPLVWALGAGVAVLLILLLVWLMSGDDSALDNDLAGDAAGAETAAVATTAPDDVSDDDRVVFEPNLPDEPIEQPQTSASVVADVNLTNQPADDDAQIETETSAASSANEPATRRRLTEGGDDTLNIRFAEDSWLVIRDGEGRKLYSNLGRRGAELAFVGEAPFRLVIGYAPGATIRFNGDSVALAPHTRNDVAKLFLGQ